MNQETITQRAQAITTLRRTKVEAPVRPLQEDLRDVFADDVFEYSPSDIIAFRINSANGWGRGVRAARRADARAKALIRAGVQPPATLLAISRILENFRHHPRRIFGGLDF